MPSLEEELNQLAAALRPLFTRLQVLRAFVFGSAARNETSRHSDLDLMVIWETPQRFLDRYDVLLPEIARAVPHRDIDLLIYTPAEFRAMADRPFIRRIRQEAKTIYESDKEPASGRAMAVDR